MSGPEWTPKYPDTPVEGRPLSGGLGVDGSIHHPPLGPNPFGAERAREFDRSQFDRDDAEAEANRLADEGATARPGKLLALVGAVGSVFKRRHKADRPSSESTSVDSDVDDSEEDLDPKPSRRWAPSTWTWETRVGVAAVLSFLILVGVFVRGKWVKLELPKKDGEEVASKAPETPEPGDTPKSPIVAAKPPGKPTDPSKTSPPMPDLAVGTSPRLHDTPTTADPNRIPEAPSPGTEVSLATDPRSTPEPTSPPDAGLPTMPPPVGTELLTQASTGDTSKPLEMPGPIGDAPTLPTNDPPGGSLPSMPANVASNPAEVKPGPEAKPNEPASPSPSGVGIDFPAEVVTQTPQPSDPPPATEPPAQPAIVAETTPPPQVSPPRAEPKPEVAAAPQPANPPSGLEKVPAPAPGSSASAMGPGWVALAPSASKRPGAISSGDPGISDASSGVDSLATTSPSPRLSDGMSPRDDPAAGDPKGEAVPHTVEPDENFWTISKKYYSSGRYYKALHKANARQVPDIAKLYVGTVIRIPPPEELDRSLIDPPALGAAIDGPSVSRVSAPKSVDADSELAPTRRARPGLRRARNEPVEEPRRPTYKVKPNDTLRSIARDTLSDSKRSLEIYNLNKDILDDPKTPLTPGSSLTLPEDAVIGRKIR